MDSSLGLYVLFLTCEIKERVSYLHTHFISKCNLLGGLSIIASSTYMSSYGLEAAAANESILASFQK
jgi:hypothetical protein